LFFWEREVTGSSAQIDYLITVGSHIVPIEVKSGKTGSLKSLLQFMKEKKSAIGVRICQSPLSFENRILTVPFYMIAQIPRLVKSLVG